MSDFNSLVQYTVENISRPVKYIIYKLTEFIRVVDKFVFRQVPSGAASGYATIEQIEGNTVVWNQLYNRTIQPTITRNGITVTNNGDGSFTLSGECSANFTFVAVNFPTFNHTYLMYGNQYTRIFLNNYSNIPTIPTGSIIKTFSDLSTADQLSYRFRVAEGTDLRTPVTVTPKIFDLTLIFGAGNEPTTVADFEAWMAQNIGTLPYYDYNAGELISCKMSGMQTEDSSQQTLDTIALDVTTITGINTATNVREVIFPNGMKQADRDGTIKDTLDLRSDTATVNVGSRAYQAGDESDTSVITDGTTTYYALTTPIEYTDLQDANGNPLNPRYKVEQGGTEQVLPVNNSTPTTVAPTLTTTYTKDVH